MPHYACRITHPWEYCERFIKQWALHCDGIAVYQHEGSKTGKKHIHLAINNSVIGKKQLRNIAMTFVNPQTLKGNENMSFKEYDLAPEYMTYMTKGKHEPSLLHNYSMEQHEAWKAAWKEPTEYEKTSNNESLYDMLFEEQPSIDEFYTLKAAVKEFVHRKISRVWGMKEKNIYTMLMNSYIYDLNIPIPKEYERLYKW